MVETVCGCLVAEIEPQVNNKDAKTKRRGNKNV